MSALAALLAGLGGGWAACYLLVARRVRGRAEWWLRAYAEGQQRPRVDMRRPW